MDMATKQQQYSGTKPTSQYSVGAGECLPVAAGYYFALGTDRSTPMLPGNTITNRQATLLCLGNRQINPHAARQHDDTPLAGYF